jgi:hypothetical protein
VPIAGIRENIWVKQKGRPRRPKKLGCVWKIQSHIYGMTDVLDNGPRTQEEPKLIIRRASHAPVWSVWATLEGTPSEEIFEGASEEEAMSWINTGGQSWLDDRRRKRNA